MSARRQGGEAERRRVGVSARRHVGEAERRRVGEAERRRPTFRHSGTPTLRHSGKMAGRRVRRRFMVPTRAHSSGVHALHESPIPFRESTSNENLSQPREVFVGPLCRPSWSIPLVESLCRCSLSRGTLSPDKGHRQRVTTKSVDPGRRQRGTTKAADRVRVFGVTGGRKRDRQSEIPNPKSPMPNPQDVPTSRDCGPVFAGRPRPDVPTSRECGRWQAANQA